MLTRLAVSRILQTLASSSLAAGARGGRIFASSGGSSVSISSPAGTLRATVGIFARRTGRRKTPKPALSLLRVPLCGNHYLLADFAAKRIVEKGADAIAMTPRLR